MEQYLLTSKSIYLGLKAIFKLEVAETKVV